ncbi:germin-like protein subfamily T member 2 [Solanum pennellii]|uniref:Germin-like protein n=1 Tax=Solanum pennellii TaxID=28526 RepID=A0ABM1GD13_SOLPN|nr:germin-like protein subfamily T member 2 [Solanum pennellii]
MAIRVTFLLVVLVVLPFPSDSADPDPLQDFCVAILNDTSTSLNGFPCKPASQVTSNDFFFDGLTIEGNTENAFGFSATVGNVLSFPGLNTQGLSMNRIDFAPGGLNPPHSHPRATESGVVIKGKIYVGFVTTKNVLYSKVLTAGEMFVVPRGLVHFQMNVGKEKAMTITAFNSHLPGAVVLPTTLFTSKPSIPDEVLTKAFKIDATVIDDIKAKLGAINY